MRGFDAFCSLHSALHARHGVALKASGATLPNKFRWPSSKRAEGEERRPMLDAYLKALVRSSELEASEPVRRFLEIPDEAGPSAPAEP